MNKSDKIAWILVQNVPQKSKMFPRQWRRLLETLTTTFRISSVYGRFIFNPFLIRSVDSTLPQIMKYESWSVHILISWDSLTLFFRDPLLEFLSLVQPSIFLHVYSLETSLNPLVKALLPLCFTLGSKNSSWDSFTFLHITPVLELRLLYLHPAPALYWGDESRLPTPT